MELNKIHQIDALEGLKKIEKEINKVIKYLKSIVWCNAHDTAWIENTIEKLEKISEKARKENQRKAKKDGR